MAPYLALLLLLVTGNTAGQLPVYPVTQTVSSQRRQPIQTLTIAHAFGGIDGKTYLNCKECFENTYQRGYRYFEGDLWMASDGRIVFMHDGQEKRFGLPIGFTSSQFMARRLEGKYSPLDALSVARMMRDKPDWYLITDVKSDNSQVLQMFCQILAQEDVDCRERVIPEFYAFQEIGIVQRLHFRRAILALYRMYMVRKGLAGKLLALIGRNQRISEEEILHFVARYPVISAVSMPTEDWSQAFNDRLRQLGVQTFVHTINSSRKAQAYFRQNTGIFTDDLPNRPL